MVELKVEKLEFLKGDQGFSKEEFVKVIKPYFEDLRQVNRTNFLFVALHGDGTKSITGYRTGTTLNATLNSHILKCERTKGTWALYSLHP